MPCEPLIWVLSIARPRATGICRANIRLTEIAALVRRIAMSAANVAEEALSAGFEARTRV